ncbi:molybdopterin-dependent oxidoreductase [Methyloligella sp. 2.7D]|uniref:molybdopterin-dependent oxidoreductase n=1 Tax=unclassified Methyloligella TaxID=2625955 RepID=UPI00157E1CE7|nr:molybdopterin-dependent oxidoreductase [Methyloligella sp. GL2]QKP76096.1 molybdopterin-dependent oxidoreductase [Methyloligella sp. GL2]
MSKKQVSRRSFLTRGAALGGTLLLGGCDSLSRDPLVQRILASAETLTEAVQRAILTPNDLAREYAHEDISADFKANGSTNPRTPDYLALAENDFRDWRLEVGGLVQNELSLSLDELRAMPSRSQITRHDCVEGWSCIGQWKGVQLSHVLNKAALKPNAKYIVFYCYDDLGRGGSEDSRYYESIAFPDAFHEQTILAYEMNGERLGIPHGAPLRVRVERQLGYKMAKYIRRIEAVESFDDIRGGHGGFWEDRGYTWYAGI